MSNEIREAVQMVLTRMETHPEDFYDDMRINSRFAWVWNALNNYGLNEAETDALKQGFDKLMYRKFHDRVLESLLNDSQPKDSGYREVMRLDSSGNLGIGTVSSPHSYALNTSTSNALLANSIQIGKQTLTEALVQKLKNL